MNTNRLSPTIAAALNDQMTKEAHASQIYLSYAAWADSQGLGGTANFLFRHAQEERNHMMKILEYILKRGAKVVVTEIPGPGPDPKSVKWISPKLVPGSEHDIVMTAAEGGGHDDGGHADGDADEEEQQAPPRRPHLAYGHTEDERHTTLPSLSTSWASAIAASSASCVTSTMVVFLERCTSRSRSMMCRPFDVSRLPVGSSASTIGGLFASARASSPIHWTTSAPHKIARMIASGCR
jgi:hypothetical protein